nr:BTAD domain-containing putative transcriptional regulator [Streptomyces sp. HUCO-GS316]
MLGPLRAWRHHTELPLGPPQQRAVLALLLLRRGRTAGVGALVDGIWGADPPAAAVSVLRTYVSRLRKLLEPDRPADEPPRLVVSLGDGYALRSDAVLSDLDRFEDLVARAGARRSEGDDHAAVQLLCSALELWQGAPLAGLPGPQAEAERTHLEERRMAVLETRLRIELDLGQHAQVLPELTALREAFPLHEALCELLLVALYRSGRRAEALDVYAHTRRTLVDELGIEPGPSLRALHAGLLADDTGPPTPEPPRQEMSDTRGFSGTATGVGGPADAPFDEGGGGSGCGCEGAGGLDADASRGFGTGHTQGSPVRPIHPTSAVRPSQLPTDLATFAGRRTELEGAAELLPEQERPRATVIGLISGMAGAGKTTLAVHWAHRIAHRFPDGSLYVNLRGHDPSGSRTDPGEAIETFLVALGVAPQAVPEGLDAQAALYRSVLADRRVLIVLDNARDTEQVVPLLPAAPGCLVIVTSRSRLSGLVARHGAHPLTLSLLSDEESLELLARRLGEARVDAEPEAARAIVGLCARLPLALSIVAARAALHPGFRLADIAAELREDHGSLDAFSGGDSGTDARAVFSWSYHALSSEAAGLFRRLALHPGPDITAAAAAALSGVAPRPVRTLLTELTGASLLIERAPGRFVFHDLLRAYAGELTERHDGEGERGAARLRMYDHYLRTAHHASAVLGPFRETIPLPQSPTDSEPLRFNNSKQATAWLGTERHVLRSVVEHAAAHGHHDHAWRTACILDLHFDRLGYWHDLMEINKAGLRAARALGDRVGEAHGLRALGFGHTRFGHTDEALRLLGSALELFRAAGDASGRARTHRCLAYQNNRIGRYDVALGHYAQATELYRSLGHRSGEASVLNEVGWTYILLGDAGNAVEHCEKAVALHQEVGDLSGEAAAQDSVGYAHHHLGNHGAAVARFELAVNLYRELGNPHLEADTLRHLGDSHRATGDHAAARTAWTTALALLEEAGHAEADEVKRELRALEREEPSA